MLSSRNSANINSFNLFIFLQDKWMLSLILHLWQLEQKEYLFRISLDIWGWPGNCIQALWFMNSSNSLWGRCIGCFQLCVPPRGHHPDSSSGCTGDVFACGSQSTLMTETLPISSCDAQWKALDDDDDDASVPKLCLVPVLALVIGNLVNFPACICQGSWIRVLDLWSFIAVSSGGSCANVIVIKGKCRSSVLFKVREVLSQEDKQKNYQEGKITTLNYNPILSHQITMTCCPLKDIYTSHHFSSLIKCRYKKLSIMKCDFSCELHAYKKNPAFRVNFNDIDSL